MALNLKQIIVAIICIVLNYTTSFAAVVTVWTFDDGNLTAQNGPSTLQHNNTVNDVSFGTASSFGLPTLGNNDFNVMNLEKGFAQNQSLLFDPAAPPNGGLFSSFVNKYTFGFDILIPNQNYNTFSFYNTWDLTDSQVKIQPESAGGGIGINNIYDGAIINNQWHRVVLAIEYNERSNETYLNKYLDGTFLNRQLVNTSGLGAYPLETSGGSQDGNPSFTPTNGMFNDDNGETNPAFLGSMLFTDRTMTQSEIAALGGPTANGFAAVPEPSSYLLISIVAIVVLGDVLETSCCLDSPDFSHQAEV